MVQILLWLYNHPTWVIQCYRSKYRIQEKHTRFSGIDRFAFTAIMGIGMVYALNIKADVIVEKLR